MSRGSRPQTLRGAALARTVVAAWPWLTVTALASAAPTSTAPVSAAPTVTISPLPGTRDASPQTQISFLGVPANEIRDISVRGSRSGSHTGRLQSYASATGASFLASKPCVEGEQVLVSALFGPSSGARRVTSSFTIARLANIRLGPNGGAAAAQGSFSLATKSNAARRAQGARAHASASTPKPGTVQRFASEPSISPSTVSVTLSSPKAEGGDVFLTFNHGYGQPGAMIADQTGRLVWFEPAPKGDISMDLHV